MRKLSRQVVQWCARHGVAPIEILIVVLVLGVLASLIVPPFSAASPDLRDTSDKDSSLRDALQFVRTQIIVFKTQHRDVAPGYPGGDIHQPADAGTFVAQLTEYSDQSCRLSAKASSAFPLGKYLDGMPKNPLTDNAEVWVTTGSPAPDPSRPFGWIYNPKTLDFRPNLAGNDSRGVAYSDY